MAAFSSSKRKFGAAFMIGGLVLLLVGLLAPQASAEHQEKGEETTALSGDSGDAPETKTENCNGILPTPGSENTNKTLVEGESDLTAGGTAVWEVTFPTGDQGGESDDLFEVTDCVLAAEPDGDGNFPTTNKGEIDLKDYDVLDHARFENVDNTGPFTVSWAIPSDIAVGTQVCNVAKTTEGPSAPPASNRKAGAPSCFVVTEVEVLETTTTTEATTTTTELEVENLVEEQTPTTAQVLGTSLARTGVGTQGLLLVSGLALMLGGMAIYFGESPAAAQRRS